MEYEIQMIHFNGKKTHRILQNVGGPCPLLGLCNVLLLNNDIRVNHKISSIKFSDLTHCLKDHLQKLFEMNMGSKSNIDESQMANAIKNIEDCVALFPKLEEGLDINVKFSDVTDFEYTSAIAMFDNYNIRLLHGWSVDPQDTELYPIIKDKSYNEVVDFLTSDTDSNLDDAHIAKIEQEKAIVRQFLSDYQQQLTAHGLIRLHEVMNQNEIAIFFRNNHFSAVYKRQGHIWELVTDEGIVTADPRIIWQSLSQLSGDEQFVSNTFNVLSQNINQQAHIESCNIALKQKQKQEEKDDNNDVSNDISSNNNNNNTNNNSIKENIDEDNKALDTAIAQRLELEEQLGLGSGQLERFEQEQREAMQQLKIQQQIQQDEQQIKYGNRMHNNNNNNNNNTNATPVYAHSYDTRNRKRRNKRNTSKRDDSCVIL